MDVILAGTPSRLNDLPNGQCFSFDGGDKILFGIKIGYPQSPNSRILVLNRGVNQPPSMQSGREPVPSIVYNQPEMAIITATTPHRLREGIANPQPGHIAQFENDIYIGFADEYGDPSFVSLRTGLINPNRTNGPAAVFDSWRIVLKREKEDAKLIFEFALPRAA